MNPGRDAPGAPALADGLRRGVALEGEGRWAEAAELYRWFLPLLRLDAGPQFVHLVKLAQARAGWGNERLRLPRLPLEREQRDRVMSIIDVCMKVRPSIAR